jgi:hypothetical protein
MKYFFTFPLIFNFVKVVTDATLNTFSRYHGLKNFVFFFP